MLYTEIKRLQGEIKELTNLGVINPVWIRNIQIFERFHELREQGVCVYCCYEFVAEEEGVSYGTVKQVVRKLSV